jgi:putative pyoverdin transport system ATP-binding/permease protein
VKFFVETYGLIRFLLGWARDLRKARTLFGFVLVAGFVAGLCNTALIALIRSALALGEGEPAGALVWGFAALCVALPVSRLVSQAVLLRLTTGALYEMRMQLSRRVLRAPLRLLEEIGPHRLLAALTEDIPAVSAVVAQLPLLCMHVTIVVSCLAYLCYLSPVAFLWVLGFLVFGILTYQLPLSRAMRHLWRAREKNDEVYKGMRALTEGTKELKLHRERREAFLEGSLGAAIISLNRHHIAGNTIYMAASGWGQVLFFVLIGLLLFALPGLSGRPGAGVLVGFTLTLLYIMTPLEVILTALPALGRARAAVDKIESLGLSLSGSEAEAEAPASPSFGRGWRELELARVTQVYRREGGEESFALGPIDLTIRPGELLFVIGGNGSGKTTLAKLIVGLYPPESGEISVDGRPVTDANRDEYRQLFSAVFSDFYLFENLLGLGADGLDERAREYLGRLQLEHKVRVEGGTLSTLDLSQGQRKRLALLTAYLEDRPIYLFDEWAADQDPYFREVFYQHLLPELKARGKTVIIISHDDRYFHLADRIIKLDYGKVEPDPRLEAAPLAGARA